MWHLYGVECTSHLLLGTSLYPSPAIMREAIIASQTNIITVSVRRQAPIQEGGKRFWDYLKDLNCHILPNTAGCYSVNEAVTTAQMAREIFNTAWIKLEVIENDYTLAPDADGLLEAAAELIKQDFKVFPYCTEDLSLCEKLLEIGCQVLMPWGAPIGSGQGLLHKDKLITLREKINTIPLIIDAGIGKPSHACTAMELGYDGILLNTAVAMANDPVAMAKAFAQSIEVGQAAYQAGIMPERQFAYPSTPDIGKPFWLAE